jgi:hypothetical protein
MILIMAGMNDGMACKIKVDRVETIKVTVKVETETGPQYVAKEINREDWPVILSAIDNMVYDEKQYSDKNPNGYMLKMTEPPYEVKIRYQDTDTDDTMLLWDGGGRVIFNGKWYHIQRSDHRVFALFKMKSVTLNPGDADDNQPVTGLKDFDKYFIYVSDHPVLLEKSTRKPYTGRITAIHKDYREELNYEDGYLSGWQALYYTGEHKSRHEYRMDGQKVFWIKDEMLSGYRSYHENGTVRLSRIKESAVHADIINPLVYRVTYYYDTGVKKAEGLATYEQHLSTDYGRRMPNEYVETGYWITYHENGRIASEGEYGSVYRSYRLTGAVKTWRYYNEKGELIETKNHGEHGEKR